jgi:hypothetical protein
MDTDEFATEPPQTRRRWREKALLPVFIIFFSVSAVAEIKN